MGLIRLGNKPPLTVAPEDTVVRAARAMTERRVGAATVLEGTGVVGVVTERDVMEKVVAADEHETLVGMLALRYLLYDLMDDMERNVSDLIGHIMTDGPGG